MKLHFKKKTINHDKKYYKKYLFFLFVLLFFLLYFFYKINDDLKYKIIIDSFMESNDLEIISLNIDFKGISKIHNKRKEAIYNKRLITSDSDFVNAQISLNENIYECKIRLKGDLSDHWAGDKYSLRVEMKKGNLIKGMSKFSLQDPATRKGTSEYLFLNHLKLNNCLAVNYDYVNLVLNGKNMGIYAIEEHFSKEFIESNSRRVGAIATFDDSLVWHKYKSTNINRDSVFRSLPTKIRKKKSLNANISLSRQNDTAINLVRSIQENSLPSNLVFEPEYIGKFLAIVRLWSAEHCLEMDDINFFFNPITSKLEPIGFDGIAGRHTETPYCYFTSGYPKDNWVNFALSNVENAKQYVEMLDQLSRLNIKSLFNEVLLKREEKVRNLRIKEVALNYPKVFLKNLHSILNEDPWINVEKIQEQIRRELDTDLHVTGFASPTTNPHFLEVTLKNCTTQPIEVSHFNYLNYEYDALNHQFNNSRSISLTPNLTKLTLFSQGFGYKQSEYDSKFLIPVETQHDLNSSDELSVNVRFLGMDDYKQINIPIDKNVFNKFELPYFPRVYPDTFKEVGNIIYVKSGNHRIRQNLFIPKGKVLRIEGDANLYFDENAAFVSNGKLLFKGNSGSKINLTSAKEMWPGIFLHCSNETSHFDHVIFSNIKGIGIDSNPNGTIFNGWSLTGGVSVYKSQISIDHCTFKNFTSEDALNVVSSNFTLQDSNFSDIRSDAFDGDFVSGEVNNCHFIGINGDGVDFSGSQGSVSNCHFNDVSDKAISVGENSIISVYNSTFEDVSFGVVSKDLSITDVSGCFISNAKTSAFSAFQKKKQFGPGSINVTDSNISSSKNDFFIQLGSFGKNNGKKVKSSIFNVEDLYNKY